MDVNASVPVLAKSFCQQVVSEFRAAELREINRRNRRPEYVNACATHDYCDANMLMVDAWTSAGLGDIDMQDDTHVAVWNAAWDAAKRAGFNSLQLA